MGGEEKEWMGCLLDDLRAFDTDADQWTTAAQDKEGWSKTAEQGADVSSWRNNFLVAAEKARTGLRHTVVCPNVTGRTENRIAQSKLVRAGSLAIGSS